jgi:hypothetical protein
MYMLHSYIIRNILLHVKLTSADTVVATFLCEGDRRFLQRKTGVARILPNAGDPLYKQVPVL